MPAPRKHHTLETKPKRIYLAPGYRTTIDLKNNPVAAKALVDIRRCVENGYRVPECFYRSDRDTTPDQLLEDLGVMHLHLGHPGTRELLYLVEFENVVVFLEVSDHVHVDTRPIGGVLKALHELPPLRWHETEKAQVGASIRKTLRKRTNDDRDR